MSEELHWYHLTILYQNGMGATYRSASFGYAEQKVTIERMSFAKKHLDAPDNAVIISVSYLGLMTREEFGA